MHWSDASFGYFPTYALGSAYAAQMYHAMQQQLNVDDALRNNHFEIIRDWLKEHIHCHGAYLNADQILKKVSGESFNPDYYIQYLMKTYKEVYHL